MRRSTPNLYMQGIWSGFRQVLAVYIAPGMNREYMSLNMAKKIERHVRIQNAIKANKIDFRALLALPVSDYAHPYKQEYPWERVIQSDIRTLSGYGKWYATKMMVFYETLQFHKWGCTQDDLIPLRSWWVRAARTRSPQLQIVHMDRRVNRARMMKDKYLYEPKSRWVHPIDNTAFFSPYCLMVADEWEEKWGFFAGQEVEY
jgi:ubiquinol-cytochrome c reductase subunit 7